MRQVSAKLLDRESLAELESGHRLQLVQSGRTIAEIVPVSDTVSSAEELDEISHREAVQRLREIMDGGIHLGGLRIANRDELYDRD
jgi:antitoxin (DNA-binding transcriptional repressor) of toxin-antitoxin stability system